MAADMPVKARPAPPVPYFSWTGCYLGAHIGGAWGRKEFSDPTGLNFAPPGQAVNFAVRGPIGGGQIGCDYQFAPNFVVGLEADIAAASIRGDANDPFFAGKNFASRTSWLASATGRAGYAFDRTLIYAKGGAAWARDQYDTTGAFLGFTSAATVRENRAGWIAGLGVEQMIWDNWSIKLEYDHYDFGTRRVTFFDPAGGLGGVVFDADVRQRIDAVKVGINYRFGVAPVIARY